MEKDTIFRAGPELPHLSNSCVRGVPVAQHRIVVVVFSSLAITKSPASTQRKLMEFATRHAFYKQRRNNNHCPKATDGVYAEEA